MRLLQLTLLFLLVNTTLLKSQNNTRITSYYDINDQKSYYLAWDIKTGKSIQYYWNGTDHKWESFEINIPAKPVVGALGNIMFDVYFDNKDKKAYYIAWDTKTGKSTQYYWDGTVHKYIAFEINLPNNPLPGNVGEVMIKSYYDTRDNKGYFIVYDTNGGKSIQYYWNGTDHKFESFEINLPAQPLLGK